MHIRKRHGWEIPESRVTPEQVFFNRRQFIGGAGMLAAAVILPDHAQGAEEDPSTSLYPVPANPAFKEAGRAITDKSYNITFNNFYEFGSSKQIYRAAEALPIRPWEIAIDGMVEKPFVIAIDDLLKKMTLEERVYRHRCVEAWAMTVPWSGFPLRKLVELAKPTSAAKYLRMETFNKPEIAPGQRPGLFGGSYPWPYVEGVTMPEAMNDLAFVATGAYGAPLPKAMGAPIRLHLPWKYGFKSIKSIVRVSFTDKRPVSFWEQLAGNEYGFWANVNPEVPHPRWSQANERILGTNEEVPTQLFNGYGELVAGLYKGLESEKLFM
jgi:methionine sulfoxide reductase catalytic subunit